MEFNVFFKILVRRRYVFIPFFLLILGVPLLLSIWKEPIYEASSTIIFKKSDLQTSFLEGLPKAFGEIAFFDTEDTQENLMTFLEDDINIQRVISDLGYDVTIKKFHPSFPSINFLMSAQQQALSINEKSGNEIFQISGYAVSEKEAACISKQFVKIAAETIVNFKKSAATKMEKVIIQHNQETNRKLKAVLKQKNLFLQQNNYVDINKQLDNLYSEISKNRELEQKQIIFLQKIKKKQKALKQQLSNIPEFHKTREDMQRNPILAKAEEQLVDLLWELAEMKTKLTDEHKDLISRNLLIEEVKETIRNEKKNILSGEIWERNAYNTNLVDQYNENLITIITAQIDIQVIQKFIEVAKKKTITLAVLEADFQLLADKILLYKNIIQQDLNTLNAISVVDKMDIADFEIIHLAGATSNGSTAFFPNYKTILFFSLFLAFWIAFVITLFVDYIDPSLKSIERVESLFGISIFTEISHKKRGSTGLIPSSLMACEKPIRHILSWLKKGDNGSSSHMIGVVSSKFGEGVTHTGCRVAKQLACLGERVLLVETNAVFPCLEKTLNVTAKYGAIDVLNGRSNFTDSVVEIEPNLSALVLLKRDRNSFYLRQDFLKKIVSSIPETNEFQWIVVDLPPINEDAAAVDILDQCDSIIYNIALMKVRSREIKKAMMHLMKKKNILERTIFITNRHRPFWPDFLKFKR